MDSPLLSHGQHWTFSSCFPVKSDVHVKKYMVLCRIRLGDFPESSVCSAALFCLVFDQRLWRETVLLVV